MVGPVLARRGGRRKATRCSRTHASRCDAWITSHQRVEAAAQFVPRID